MIQQKRRKMDKITYQNAANAEESASSSEEMDGQAEQMKGVVQKLVVLVGGTGKSVETRQYSEVGKHETVGTKPMLCDRMIIVRIWE